MTPSETHSTTRAAPRHGRHSHSRYVAGCATCELDRLYVRICLLARWRREQAATLWHARDAAGLTVLWAQVVGT